VLGRGLAPAYLCPVTATNGQCGGFLHTNVVPILRDNERPVLYVGDHDPQGEDIERNTRRVLEREAGPRGWRRVALTGEQAAGLPAIEKVDRRCKPPRRSMAVEVEALGQGAVTSLVKTALDELLPEPIETVQVRQRRDKQRVRLMLDELQRGG
jgi:hypothetical protein